MPIFLKIHAYIRRRLCLSSRPKIGMNFEGSLFRFILARKCNKFVTSTSFILK